VKTNQKTKPRKQTQKPRLGAPHAVCTHAAGANKPQPHGG